MQEDIAAPAAAPHRSAESISSLSNAEDSEEEGSIVDDDSFGQARVCAVCSTTNLANDWYRCPESLGTSTRNSGPHVMCEDCGMRWRKYGIEFAPTSEEIKGTRKSVYRSLFPHRFLFFHLRYRLTIAPCYHTAGNDDSDDERADPSTVNAKDVSIAPASTIAHAGPVRQRFLSRVPPS